MKPPRLTVRRLMVVVAVLALACWAEVWRRRSAYCEVNLSRCARAERTHLELADGHGRVSAIYRKLAAGREGSLRYNLEQAAIFERAIKAERHEAIKATQRARAFRMAALLPWVSLPPPERGPSEVAPER